MTDTYTGKVSRTTPLHGWKKKQATDPRFDVSLLDPVTNIPLGVAMRTGINCEVGHTMEQYLGKVVTLEVVEKNSVLVITSVTVVD